MDENDLEDLYVCQMLMLAATDTTDESDIKEEPPKCRIHKVWVRGWIQDRDDHTQRNTMFKLQEQLQQVNYMEIKHKS